MKSVHNSKKLLCLSTGALFLIAISLFALCACDINRDSNQQKLADSCIRIHIRANSNGSSDQSVKLAVRDKVTAYLENALSSCRSKQDAQKIIQRERANLVRIADSTLSAHGFSYKASIRIDNEFFPDRTYDGYEFPAGNYDAVVINLGSGNGDNWWCVAFPPLCFVPDTQDGEKIVYKSWIKEMLDKLFN